MHTSKMHFCLACGICSDVGSISSNYFSWEYFSFKAFRPRNYLVLDGLLNCYIVKGILSCTFAAARDMFCGRVKNDIRLFPNLFVTTFN